MAGSSSSDDFSRLVARATTTALEGIVVVQANYRLNLIGFLASVELSEEQGTTSGNYGIRDQLLALKWVKTNIAFFSE